MDYMGKLIGTSNKFTNPITLITNINIIITNLLNGKTLVNRKY